MHEGDEALPPAAGIVATVDGVSGAHGVPTMVQGAVERRKCVEAKMFTNGGFRSSSVVGKMLPHGGAGLKNKVPKRKDYGAEGADGDEAHAAAMKEFSIADFGGDHVQGLTFERRMGFVGLYGWWLELLPLRQVRRLASLGWCASSARTGQRTTHADRLTWRGW
jgi:hypothetical protein